MENITINRVVEGKIVQERNVANISPLWQQRMEQERIERERVEQEMRVARRIQQASLPKEVPQLEGWQISPYYRPAREVGDATGKGVPAALVMSTTCGMLQLAAPGSSAGPIEPGGREYRDDKDRVP
jgi:serine phosphatase RsbU (regulator of sigma subunit)